MTPEQLAPRIAEVVVVHRDGRRRGSGFRVTGTAVLTAAHVVDAADTVEVRFESGRPGAWSAPARVIWIDLACDVAVLDVEPPAQAPPADAVSYGRLPDRRAVVAVSAAGYPRWKRREGAGGAVFRELHDAAGTVAVLSNRRLGTLEITVEPPAADPGTAGSPWEGMSGAAVWAGDLIVGVVAEQHHREGLGRLSAVRLDRLLDRDDLAAALGVGPGAAQDVLPAGQDLARSGYTETIRDIAPARGLIGREEELDELARFCAGDEPYVWWQAGPWAGKSALMATFVLEPPVGVSVVSFFVTGRLAAQADSTAFTDALLEQLTVLTGETLPSALSISTRDHYRRALLRSAAAALRARGRTLVLVVDGLDEDRGAAPGAGLASIAALLPKAPDPNLRVVVAGRPDPPIPEDVSEDHPLRAARVRRLAPSEHAGHVARLARREMQELLSGDPAHQDVIGILAACDGGLTLAELHELTGMGLFRLEVAIGGVFGRTVAERTDQQAQRVLLFTHETLSAEAAERLGPQLLTGYRDRLHRWADGYRDLGWPQESPQYLLRGYPRLLQTRPDVPRLVALATDPARHRRLLLATGGDAAALAEIGAAQELVLAGPEPDLRTMVRLAVHRDAIADRNASVPEDLPAVWAALGSLARAEAVARSIGEPYRRGRALTALVGAVGAVGSVGPVGPVGPVDSVDSVGSVGSVGDDAVRRAALVDLVVSEARTLADPYLRAELLTLLVECPDDAVAGRRSDLAGAVAGLLDGTDGIDRKAPLLLRVIEALAAEDPAGAEALGKGIDDEQWRHRALVALARAASTAGDGDRAAALAAEITDDSWRSQALGSVVAALAARGDLDHAESLARAVPDPSWRTTVLRGLAQTVARTDPARAEALAAAADAGYDRGLLLIELIGIVAAGPARDRLVEALAQEEDRTSTAELAAALASARVEMLAAAGDLQRAEAMLYGIADGYARAQALVATVDAAAGDPDRFAVLAQLLVPAARLEIGQVPHGAVLSDWARRYAGAGHHERAVLVAAAADATSRDSIRAGVAEIAAAAGDHPAAWTAVAAIDDPELRDEAVMRLAQALAVAGEVDAAVGAVATLADPLHRSWALGAVAGVVAESGQWRRAHGVALGITDDNHRGWAMTEVVRSAATSGPLADAETLAAAIDVPFHRDTALAMLARTAAAADGAAADGAAADVAAGDVAAGDVAAGDVAAVDGAAVDGAAVDGAAAVRLIGAMTDRQARAFTAAALAEDFGVPAVFDLAVGSVDAVADPAERVQLLRHLIRAAVGPDRAFAAAVAGGDDGDELLAFLVRVLLTGDAPDTLERAAQAAARIADPGLSSGAQVRVVRAAADAGETGRAWRLAREPADDAVRSRTLAELAGRLSLRGDLDDAAAALGEIPDPAAQAAPRAALLTALVTRARYPDARAVALAAPDVGGRTAALRRLVTQLASRGRLRQAKAVIGGITDPALHASLTQAAVWEAARVVAIRPLVRFAQATARPAELTGLLIDAAVEVFHLRGTAAGLLVLDEVADPAERLDARLRLAEAVGVAGLATDVADMLPLVPVDRWPDVFRRIDAVIAPPRAAAPVYLADPGHAGSAIPDDGPVLGGDQPAAGADVRVTQRRTQAVITLLDAVVRHGDPFDVVPLVESVPDGQERIEIAVAVAGAAAAADVDRGVVDRLAEVVEATSMMGVPEHWAQLVVDLADALARIGDHYAALGWLHYLGDPAWTARQAIGLARTLALSGRIGQALEVTETVHGAQWRRLAHLEMVGALAVVGQFDRAEELAGQIDDPQERAQALSGLAHALLSAGQRDRAATTADLAEATARSFVDGYSRAYACVTPALSLADADADADTDAEVDADADAEVDADAVGELRGRLFEATGQAVRDITDPQRQRRLVDELVALLVQYGQITRAVELTGLVADPIDRAWMQTSLVRAAVGHDAIELAAAIAAEIAEPNAQSNALQALASAVAERGEHDRATGIALSLTEASARFDALQYVLDAAIAAGDVDAAERTGAHLTGPYWSAQAHIRLATLHAGLGAADRATEHLLAIADPYLRGQAAAALAAAGGDPEAALAHAAEIDDPTWRSRAFISAVEALIDDGTLHRAAAVVEAERDLIPEPTRRRLVSELAAEDLPAAEALMQHVIDPFDRDSVLADLVRVCAGAGALDDAVRIAATITDPGMRSRAEETLVLTLARRHRFDDAEALAARIEMADCRADAYDALLRELAAAGDLDGARELAARAGPADTLPDRLIVVLRGCDRADDRVPAILAEVDAAVAGADDPDRRGELLSGLSRALTAAGDLDGALTAARANPDSELRRSDLFDLTREAVRHGDDGTAFAAMSELRDDDYGLAWFQRPAVESGDDAHRYAVLLAAVEPDRAAERVANLVMEIAAEGDVDRAAVVAELVEDEWWRDGAVEAVAFGHIRADRSAEAAAAASTIVDDRLRAHTLGVLVDGAAPGAWTPQLVHLLQTLTEHLDDGGDLDIRARLFTGLAAAALQTGDPRGAAAFARRIPDDAERARCLAAAAAAAPPDVADALFAEALATARWTVTVPMLPRRHHAAVVDAAGLVLDRVTNGS